MAYRKITRELRIGRLESVEGCGESIAFKLSAYRDTKAGTHENYELTLTACRYSVRQLLAELKKMHERDRDRIAQETQRIEREQRGLM